MIELSKFKKYMNNTALADWVKFIINPKVIDMSNEEVKKAKGVDVNIIHETTGLSIDEINKL